MRTAPAFALVAVLVLALAACAAPAPQAGPEARNDGRAANAGASDDAQTAPRKVRMPPLGGPLPPERLGPDRSCKVDADCMVKDIGNCCGTTTLACVNRNARVDPDAARAACGDAGATTLCASPLIETCRCDAGRCIEVPPFVQPSQDPPEPVR